jgi:hypothetical protein
MKAGIQKNVVIVGSFTGVSGVKKTPYYGIEFENEEGESIEYVAYLTELTKERALGTLIELNFLGKSLADLSDTKKTMAELFGPTEEPISLTIEDEVYQDKEGNDRVKQVVKWVNVGNKGGVSKADHATAIATFKSMSFDGDLMRIKKDGKKPAPKKESLKKDTVAEGENINADDLPF